MYLYEHLRFTCFTFGWCPRLIHPFTVILITFTINLHFFLKISIHCNRMRGLHFFFTAKIKQCQERESAADTLLSAHGLSQIYKKKLGCIELIYPLRPSGKSPPLEEIFQTAVYFMSMSMKFKKSPAELMTSPLLVSSGTWRYPGTIKDHTGSRHETESAKKMAAKQFLES